MQLSNRPAKFPLAFAASGSKNTIPVASQVGITPGAASLTDGFPPLTRTPISAGGVPPSGLDMNGILYELSAIARWLGAGAGFVYDGTFANDTDVGGYPKGARVLRTDGAGYWINTADNNTTDPEGAGAVAAGWVPDFTSGASAITMTSANVTLTPLQYGKPIVLITGALTANLNLVFPDIADQWVVVNGTTGAYTVTAKTAGGTGVTLNTVTQIISDGVNMYAPSAATIPDASTSVKGKVQLATTAEAQAGVDSAKAITGADLGATVPGIGQTRQNVTRDAGTTYTNSTGRQIWIECRCSAPSIAMDGTLTIGGVVADRILINGSTGEYMLSAPVLAGQTYVITLGPGNSISTTYEIR